MMRRVLGVGLTLCLLAAAALAPGCARLRPPPAETTRATPVRVARAEMGDIERVVRLPGKIVPVAQVNLVPKMPGRVAAVYVSVGDRVSRGQTLLTLESTELRAQLRQAEAALAAARSALEQAEARYRDAASNFERISRLHEEGAVPRQQLDSAYLALTMAENQYRETGPAEVRRAEAAVEMVRAQLDNTVLSSPIAGTVAFRNVEPGEMASLSSPAFTIVDSREVYAEVGLTGEEVSRVSVGDTSRVWVKSPGGGPLSGVVHEVSPAANPQTGLFQVRVRLANTDGFLKPGMLVEAELVLERREGAVLIPEEAVVGIDENRAVFVVEDGAAREQKLELGISDGSRVEIISGVKPGEAVVIQGQASLKHGDAVEVLRGETP